MAALMWAFTLSASALVVVRAWGLLVSLVRGSL